MYPTTPARSLQTLHLSRHHHHHKACSPFFVVETSSLARGHGPAPVSCMSMLYDISMFITGSTRSVLVRCVRQRVGALNLCLLSSVSRLGPLKALGLSFSQGTREPAGLSQLDPASQLEPGTARLSSLALDVTTVVSSCVVHYVHPQALQPDGRSVQSHEQGIFEARRGGTKTNLLSIRPSSGFFPLCAYALTSSILSL
jgi:hypothetical protein